MSSWFSKILEHLPRIGFKYVVEKNSGERIYELVYKELDRIIKVKIKHSSKHQLDREDFKALLRRLREDLTTDRYAIMKKCNPRTRKLLSFY